MTADPWTLHHGEALAVLRTLDSASVDGVVTDPPYSSGGMVRGDRAGSGTDSKYTRTEYMGRFAEFSGDNRDQRGFRYWCALWLSECLRIAKPGAPSAVFTDWRQLPEVCDLLQAGGWVWRGIVPWDKTGACRPQKGRFAAQCEYIAWGSAGAMPLERGVGCLPGLVSERVRQSDKHHLTGKPTEIMRHVCRIVAPGGLILDPFAGSGTTGVAALLEGYRFAGVEMTDHYHAVAQRRLEAATNGYTLRAGQRDPGDDGRQGRLL